MAQYSIKELERLSGIKAHTIRIWEKRYGLISPRRTTGNVRLYSDEDLKKIMNVSLLNSRGLKISKIAQLTSAEISKRILEMGEARPGVDVFVDQLVICMLDLDEEAFEKQLSAIIGKFGFEKAITDVIYPFLEKIGILWQTGSITPAHEHFISNLIRQKIIVSTAALPPSPKTARKAVLFLPEGEMHEIGLLFYHFIARSRGLKTYYLGQSVPYSDLKAVFAAHQPDVMITSFISSPVAHHLEKYLKSLSTDFAKATILVSGQLATNTAFHVPKNVKLFYKAIELPALLQGP